MFVVVIRYVFYNMLITIVLQNAKNRALFGMEVDFYSNFQNW